jgi:argininosuccinate lyase
MSKLWQKTTNVNQLVEDFTVGKDREFDQEMAAFDVLGSLAHTRMLQSIGLMDSADLELVQRELKAIYADVEAGNFTIEDGVEDVHSQVEMLLTQRIGDAGKKIHSGRSRNDQVLVDLKLFFRHQLQQVVEETETLFRQLITLSEQHKDVLLPGYTHLQVAMPSSFGLWFGAYAESLADDLELVLAAYKITNKNPLDKTIALSASDGISFVKMSDILRVEANGRYAKFYLLDKQVILVSKPLGDFEEILSANQFFRIHDSGIINLNHVKKYIRGDGGTVLLSDGTALDVARRRKDDFVKLIPRL